MIGIFAFMAAAGVFLIANALGPQSVRVHLTDVDERPVVDRWMDTFFAPAAKRVVTMTGQADIETTKEGIERRLAQAGYPPPFTCAEDVLSRRLFTAVLFPVFGGAFALLIGLGSMTFLLMIGLAAFGWGLPDRIIAKAKQERQEQLTLDAASTLDRLSIFIAAGNALPAAITSLSQRRGGAWVGEFRKVAGKYSVTGNFQQSLDHVVEGSGRLPEITRVCERINAAYGMGGGGISEAMRRMAADARQQIELLITERGYKNAVKMVIPAFLAIIAATIILIGPGAVRMVSVLSGQM